MSECARRKASVSVLAGIRRWSPSFPVLTFLVIACCVLAANFIADVLYAVLDPRIRAGETT